MSTRKKSPWLSCFLAVTLTLTSLSAPAQGQSTSYPIPDLSLSAPSALLLEKETGTVLYEKDAHTPRSPASVTKIMTILLVMDALASQKATPETMISVSAQAASMGGSQVYLKEGETFSLWELLKCVVVVSGNDASVALAEFLAGSEAAFVEQMNQRAQALGMTQTNFANCTGLPAEDHFTTAYDIALMSRELLLLHPQIQELTTIWMDSIREGTFGLSNTNRLIHSYPGATGLKTGSTDQALYCMSASAQRDGVEFIAVVLKAPTSDQRFQDAQTMLDYGFATYSLTQVYPDGPLPPIPVLLGTSPTLQPQLSQSTSLLLPKAEAKHITTQVILAENLQAPVSYGQIIGNFQIYVGDVLTQTVPILAAEEVPRLGFWGIFGQLFRHAVMAE